MIEILIYGLIGFIVLVGATFLFDHWKKVKAGIDERSEQLRSQQVAQKLANKAKVLTTQVPQFSTTMSQATMNGKRLTMQELQDFLNGKIGNVNKQSDAAIEAALKSVEDEMKRLDQIFKRK